MIVRVRAGWESLIIGPRAEFAGFVSGDVPTLGHCLSAHETRRRLLIATSDPANLEPLRRILMQDRDDGVRLAEHDDRVVIDRVAGLVRDGHLVVFSQPDRATKTGKTIHFESEARESANKVSAIASMTREQKLGLALDRAPRFFSEALKKEFADEISDKTMDLVKKLLFGVLVAWAASHFVGVGELLDLGVFVYGMWTGSEAVVQGVRAMIDAFEFLETASNEEDIDKIAKVLAGVISGMTVKFFMSFITKFGRDMHAAPAQKKPSLLDSAPPERKTPPPPRPSGGGAPPAVPSTPKPDSRYHRPEPASMTNEEARKWYHSQEDRIPELANTEMSLESRARAAHAFRNEVRTAARDAMADRDAANKLMRENPNLTWDEIVAKKQKQGLQGDELWKSIFESSQKSNQGVDAKLGIKRNR